MFDRLTIYPSKLNMEQLVSLVVQSCVFDTAWLPETMSVIGLAGSERVERNIVYLRTLLSLLEDWSTRI